LLQHTFSIVPGLDDFVRQIDADREHDARTDVSAAPFLPGIVKEFLTDVKVGQLHALRRFFRGVRPVAGSKIIFNRDPIARAYRSSAEVDGCTAPLSMRAT